MDFPPSEALVMADCIRLSYKLGLKIIPQRNTGGKVPESKN